MKQELNARYVYIWVSFRERSHIDIRGGQGRPGQSAPGEGAPAGTMAPTPEQMQKMRERFENMTPEEREKMRQQMMNRRQQSGSGGGQ